MGERNTVRQPGYDGLCNYAQKITSCFGLDGKTKGKRAGRGCCYYRGDTEKAVKASGMYLVCYAAGFLYALRQRSCFLSMFVLIQECVVSCVKATTEWMTSGGQCLTAAE